jgi:succinylglutamate desuccinylase
MTDRVVGFKEGNVGRPLIILMAGLHGNEPAGVSALRKVFRDIARHDIDCSILGLIGNVAALEAKKRFLDSDLNRKFLPEHIATLPNWSMISEDREMLELMGTIHNHIHQVAPDKLFFLDLHTTSSDGGIFCIAPDHDDSIRIGKSLGIPLVTGLLSGVGGTSLHYFTSSQLGLPCVGLAVEGGHHKDPVSVYRCYAAAMRFIAATKIENTEVLTQQKYDHLLMYYQLNLPSQVTVKYVFPIANGKLFQMKPGYKHFQNVAEGEILARYDGEYVTAPMDGKILMPLYQKQGSEGFFVVQ